VKRLIAIVVFLCSSLYMAGAVAFTAAQEIEISSAKIKILSKGESVEVGLMIGTSLTSDFGFYETRAELILEMKGPDLKLPIKMLSPVTAGVQIGAAYPVNEEMRIVNLDNIQVSQIAGEYIGDRWGVATLFGGVSYLNAENEYSVTIKDYDFRVGTKLDLGTDVGFVIEFDENIKKELLEKVIIIK
jgi:hypothetical protein